MKCNDSAGDFYMLYIEPADDKAALFEVIQGQRKPVVLMLPFKPGIFQRPEDFSDLKHLKRKFNIAIIFVTAGNEHLRQLATRHGFPAYLSIEALSRALTLGQVSLSHQRTLAKTGPLSPAASPTLDVTSAARQHSAPFSPPAATARKTVPLSPLAQGASKASPFPGTSLLPPPQVSKKTSPSFQPPKARKHRRRLPVTLTILLLLVLAGAGSGYFLVFFHKSPTADPPAPQVFGQIDFLSSGQLTEDSNQGIDDEIQVDLHNLAQPAPGKSYYAWLLGDENQSDLQSILLGKLVVDAGRAHALYKGDTRHTNLLAIYSRFLITEEDDAPTPFMPSPDYSTWRYYGTFPQTPDPRDKDHASFLDHLRALLASDPLMDDMKLAGGLNDWFNRNTSQLLELTISARNAWEESKDMNAVRDQAIGILSYLDGLAFLQQDMPATTAQPTLSSQAAIGLLAMNNSDQGPDSYVSSIVYHLNGLLNAPGSPTALRANVATILQAMSNVRAWLEQLHDDARQIIGMTDEQLGQAGSLTLLNDMVEQANYAYAGEIGEEAGGAVKAGANWIYDALQALATLEVKSYQTGGSSPEIIPSTRPLAGTLPRSESDR